MLCAACVAKARDERDRPQRFANETFLGTGFVAEVLDNGTWRRREGGASFVDGVRCVAGEHRFGGIVVQAVDEGDGTQPPGAGHKR